MQEIYSTSINNGTVDEAPQAYKDPNEIIDQINGNTVKILYYIKPVINMKASSMSEYEQ